jgi:hypothetical protein
LIHYKVAINWSQKDIPNIVSDDADYPVKNHCPVCVKDFATVGSARRHYHDVHMAAEDEKTEECEICGKSAKNMNALGRHLRREHAIYNPRPKDTLS